MKQDISNIGEIVMYQPPTLSVKSVVREFQPTALVELQSNAETIVGKLSFSHLCELVHIFVSTYLLQLPDKSVLEQFIKDNDII